MSEKKKASVHRFFRDGAPYFDEFEKNVSLLFEEEDKKYHETIQANVNLIRGIHENLADCQSILRKAEALVEEARDRNAAPDEIEKLVSICKDLQTLQTNLSNEVVICIHQIVKND